MAEYLEFISIDPWHLLFTWINLLILVLILKKLLFKPVNNILEKRRAEVDKVFAEADEARANAQQSKDEYTEKLSRATDEAESIVKSATDRANRKAEELLSQTNEQVARMKEKAEADIAQERLKAASEIKDDISDMVMDIAGKVIGRELNAKDQNALIENFINQVGEDQVDEDKKDH